MNRNLYRTGVMSIATLLVVALGACGSSSKEAAPTTTTGATTTTPATDAPTPTTAAPAALKSCELVTKAQAETVIATKLQEPVNVANTDVDSCTYAGDPTGPTAQVEVYVGAGAKKIYDDDNTVLQHTFTDVPGVGDEAHEEEFAIFFRKGTTWVAIRLTSLDEFATFKPRLEALANDVAARI